MSFRQDFRAYVFDPNGLKESYKSGFRVTGSVTYAVSPDVGKNTYLEEWKAPEKRSFMVGLYVSYDQTVEVDYEEETGGDMRLMASSGVVTQLVSAFGKAADSSKKWLGLVQPGDKRLKLDTSKIAEGLVSFKLRVAIYPANGPQFIPVVARHRRGFNNA